MTEPETRPTATPAKSGILRRIAGAVAIGMVLFGILWYAVFSAVTAALVASGGTVVILAGASASDTFEMIFEAIASFVLGILSAIAGFFSSLFDWG